ncbi:TIGR03936 family radical SAM-associated protein [Clostridium autoethanogenum]|uniref:DUF2344 domain-containing protein n=2 Tax=Clostridium autoethanogenum TaxID=84023 RepID=A0A3M0SUR2_9CLOT|nr:TIGR03936 family radical SAM-associated protein [Clostridium autoethanogenum]AGY77033.1 TIGR03936 family radical SAM-associated protein [Clostridium autoethanogenum DSM 10061]ALU37175.1 hypothetical protein CLAU_2748 [Clostridium autoethanogenum DSM 10061]OVY50252.1 hypothetical protein WX72_03013 [Clostridium autoethanogenum]RMD01585.1 DUF2344 domain-containing protein [Clostridium autoethanogenum]
MRAQYLIKFSKKHNIRFIGHLDLLRTIQRMIKRSELPVEYSNGFNPHINMSIAQPLAVGVYSCGEYMDLYFEKEISEDHIKEKLNKNAPSGIGVLRVDKVKNVENKKVFKSMAEINAAKYIINIKYKDINKLKESMESLMKSPTWNTIKKTKKGEKEIDIKKLVKELNYEVSENRLRLETVISCGSVENLSPELLSSFIQNNTENADKECFIDIMREEVYGRRQNKLLPLHEYVSDLY